MARDAPRSTIGAVEPPLSKVPKVFGILSIIFGGLTLLQSLYDIARTLAGDPVFVVMVRHVLMAVMSAWLLAIGIGQVRYRARARRHAVWWSVAGVVAVVAIVSLTSAVMTPDNVPKHGGTDFNGFLAYRFVTITIALLPYPILMLVFFTRPNVRRSMSR
jgi:hypothetical protein